MAQWIVSVERAVSYRIDETSVALSMRAELKVLLMVQKRIMEDRFFNEIVAHDEIAKLKALRRVVPRWEEIAKADIPTSQENELAAMSDEQRHWHGEYVNDAYFSIHVIKEALLAGLAVSIASCIENFLAMVCEEHDECLPARSSWGDKRQGIERVLGRVLNSLPGFDSANRARILANCFKHVGGKVNEEYIAAIAVRPLGEEIEYHREDWDEMIAGVESFLLNLVALLPV